MRCAAFLSAFAHHRGGNVAILFAFLSVPMLMFGGAAIDYGFATRLETKLQAATDGTALLLCQTPLSTSTTDLNALAKTAMAGAMGAANLVTDPLVITSNPRQITLTTHKFSTVFFGKLTGTTSINPGAVARCATPVPMKFEIALVLDNTGSMSNAGDDGVTKLSALQTAAKNFVSYVFNSATFASGTKISVVPFSAAVAVSASQYRYSNWVDTQGKSAYHWTNVSGTSAAGFTSRFDIFTKLQTAYSRWNWAGCFEALPYPQNVTDMGVTSNNNSLYIPYFAPDEAGQGTLGITTWNGNYSINSYIDDDNGTSSGSCSSLPSATLYAEAERRACKYNVLHDPKPGTVISELGPNGPNFGCTTKPLQPLTTSTSTLNSIINNMTAGGVTNIHEGFMWGWRTISPKSVLYDGTAAAYTDTTVNKIIILMTDGMNTWLDNPYKNYNESFYAAPGYFINADGSVPDIHFPPANQNISNGTQARAGLDALTRLACSNAGTANVAIYTIGFSVSSDPIDAQGIKLLKDCATSGKGQYIQANDSNSLIAAFNQIASSIGKLRLTK
jgi:Flp pilus assembly protein TadG